MNGASPFSAHSDVLDAPIPDDAAARARLLEECKTRGKGAVQGQAWPDAAKLYRKALECCSADAPNQSAILNANLSLVEGKMNGWDAALTAAQTAVEKDPAYTKGWWRLGQAKAALQDYQAAVEALQEAVQLEPANKALKKELEKQQAQAKKQAAAAATDTAAASTKTTTRTTVSSSKESSSKPAATTGKTASTSTAAVDDGTFTKSDHVKGYKIVNGKKTSYFHNELSQEAAALIGDIAPKKLNAAATAPTEAASNNKGGGTSAWNKAGTWEETTVTAWAVESLTSTIKTAKYTLPDSSPAPAAVAAVESCKCTGHASVATVRGKKRYIYEFSVVAKWTFCTADSAAEAAGSLTFPDVDGTCVVGEPYDACDFIVTSSDDPTLRPVLEAFVHKQGLRDALHAAIDDWVRLFRETY